MVVVKAQIHAGGRGKGGGVKLAKSPAEAAEIAGRMLGMTLVTPQTGPGGRVVKRLLIEEGLDIKRELYLSILVDRAVAAPVVMASAAGGMEIEEVARENPAAILRETIHPAAGLAALSRAKNRVRPRTRGRCRRCGRAVLAVALPRVRGDRRIARGNQSAASSPAMGSSLRSMPR